MVYGTLCHSNRIPPSVLNLKERKALGEKECWRLQNTDDIPDPLKNRLTNRQTGTADNVYANHEYLLANTERESSRIQIDRISTLWLCVGFKCLTKTLLQLTHHRWKIQLRRNQTSCSRNQAKASRWQLLLQEALCPDTGIGSVTEENPYKVGSHPVFCMWRRRIWTPMYLPPSSLLGFKLISIRWHKRKKKQTI